MVGTGLIVVDVRVGSGPAARVGNTLTVHYRGFLQDGTQFDSSYDRNQPFSFVLGSGAVIRGWDQGLVGMRTGGVRRLIIPPDLAYGARGYPPVIPPNSTLIFDVDLVALAKAPRLLP